MKTLTEFPGMTLKNAIKTKQELVSSGKTTEELSQAMGEALKLEGDRLNLILSAIEVVESQLEDLKRVVVYTLAEGEKAPAHAIQKGDHYFLSEYYPPLERKNAPGKFDPDKKKRGRRKGRGGKRGNRDQNFQPAGAPTSDDQSGQDQPRKRRPFRPHKRPMNAAPSEPPKPSANPTKIIAPIIRNTEPTPKAES